MIFWNFYETDSLDNTDLTVINPQAKDFFSKCCKPSEAQLEKEKARRIELVYRDLKRTETVRLEQQSFIIHEDKDIDEIIVHNHGLSTTV